MKLRMGDLKLYIPCQTLGLQVCATTPGFRQCWKLNSGLHACEARSLSYIPSPIIVAFEILTVRAVLPGSLHLSHLCSTLDGPQAPFPLKAGDAQQPTAILQPTPSCRKHASGQATSPTSLKDFFTSTKECQCAMGFRGYASISFQWSLPRPSALIPTLQTPMISL